ncbi:hypothetical protein A2617_00785 [Candidatus Daviesbacteria bacterium RIFOXYD1_FULL_41_10]|uniref:ATP synthase gamma chain n=2 Tax=Microgenomates group TaxID=1794810 RepID=A0A1F5N284_9BACT|nr:MAG: ATP synthase gamma chain [Candidatus Curtissbacteria bacterium GW2011_GWA1_41_11]OGE71741.1 MAG: hypothetical protein A2617_00785 [Candidatus Daviesbacteria bacterium RIFOXYD1_FULL_41_10]
MQTIKQINTILEEIFSLKLVAHAYTEISTIKLQKIRAGIERNRTFFQEITQVYRMVKVAAGMQNLTSGNPKKGAVSILLTSNQRFYGGLEHQLTKFFAEQTSNLPTDRIVVGTTAKRQLSQVASLPVKPYIFSADIPPLEELRELVSEIISYEQIFVYYPRMQSVLVQSPAVVDLLQKPPEHYLESETHSFNSIFEPELNEMVKFFDTQITALMLEQIFLEAELARTASRLTSMNQAESNADAMIKDERKILAQASRAVENANLLDLIASAYSLRRE